jgi:hypothetical protein
MSSRKISSPALAESNLALSFAIVIPATEKIFLDGADVAGVANTFNTMLASKGYWCCFKCHHSKRLLKLPSAFFSGKGCSYL